MRRTDAEEEWQELGAISGHKGPVKGLAWSPNGEYLISAGYVSHLFLFRRVSQNKTVLIKQRGYMASYSTPTHLDALGTRSPVRKFTGTISLTRPS